MTENRNRDHQAKWYSAQKPAKALLYSLTCDLTGEMFIGATANSIQKRWWQHCAAYKEGNNKLYQSMREHGKENFTAVVIRELEPWENPEFVVNQYVTQVKAELN